jgi:hypothetical protein
LKSNKQINGDDVSFAHNKKLHHHGTSTTRNIELKKQATYNLRQKKLLSFKGEEADTFSAILAEGHRQQCTVYEVYLRSYNQTGSFNIKRYILVERRSY